VSAINPSRQIQDPDWQGEAFSPPMNLHSSTREAGCWELEVTCARATPRTALGVNNDWPTILQIPTQGAVSAKEVHFFPADAYWDQLLTTALRALLQPDHHCTHHHHLFPKSAPASTSGLPI
jgi:hypothetical protein